MKIKSFPRFSTPRSSTSTRTTSGCTTWGSRRRTSRRSGPTRTSWGSRSTCRCYPQRTRWEEFLPTSFPIIFFCKCFSSSSTTPGRDGAERRQQLRPRHRGVRRQAGRVQGEPVPVRDLRPGLWPAAGGDAGRGEQQRGVVLHVRLQEADGGGQPQRGHLRVQRGRGRRQDCQRGRGRRSGLKIIHGFFFDRHGM